MKYILTAITYALIALSLILFLKSLDRAVEVDDLKSHIASQKKVIAFLHSVNERAITSCAITADGFDQLLIRSSYASSNKWINDRMLFGPFLAERRGSCISRIEILASPL